MGNIIIKKNFNSNSHIYCPIHRRISTEKYAELSMALSANKSGMWVGTQTAPLEYQGKEDKVDKVDLAYELLRRHESIAETKTNPHLGLVQMQIARVLRLSSVNIDFIPKRIPRKTKESDPMKLFCLRSEDANEQFRMKGATIRGYSTPSVSTGKTVLENPRTGKVSSKIEAEWD